MLFMCKKDIANVVVPLVEFLVFLFLFQGIIKTFESLELRWVDVRIRVAAAPILGNIETNEIVY